MSENLPVVSSKREVRRTDDTQTATAVPPTEEATALARLHGNPYLPDGDRDVRRRVSKMTPAKKRAFCDAIANGASPTRAARALGVARSTVYYQRAIDADFAAAWEEAQEQDADRYEDALEDAAIRMTTRAANRRS